MVIKLNLESPDNLPFKALKYLESSIKKNPDKDETIWDVLNWAREGRGEIYVLKDHEIIGCCYLEFLPDHLTIVHLGGDIKSLREEVSDEFKSLMKIKKVRYLCILSRIGWDRFFKDLKPIGTFYLYDGGYVEPLGK